MNLYINIINYLLLAMLGFLCSATGQATEMRSLCTGMKSGLRSLQLEKASVEQRKPSIAKNK